MKQILKYVHVDCDKPYQFFCNNTSAINISKNHVMHSKTKHIPIRYHFVREKIAENVIKLDYVDTKEQIADIFTNPLPRDTFEYLRRKLVVVLAPQ